jgi:hypothetical protein
MIESSSIVPTENASRYLQQLCKHWAHNMTVNFTAEKGTVVFPRDARGAAWPADGVFTMTSRPDGLHCHIQASSTEQLVGLQGAVARHLDRFAFREAPLTFNWVDV